MSVISNNPCSASRPACTCFLRYGEFYRIEDGKIAEAVILLDLLDLLRQAGRMPLPKTAGHRDAVSRPGDP